MKVGSTLEPETAKNVASAWEAVPEILEACVLEGGVRQLQGTGAIEAVVWLLKLLKRQRQREGILLIPWRTGRHIMAKNPRG